MKVEELLSTFSRWWIGVTLLITTFAFALEPDVFLAVGLNTFVTPALCLVGVLLLIVNWGTRTLWGAVTVFATVYMVIAAGGYRAGIFVVLFFLFGIGALSLFPDEETRRRLMRGRGIVPPS